MTRTAPPKLVERAEAGDAEAAVDLGRWLLQTAEPPDRAGAVAWFHTAADRGSARGKHNLGVVAAQAGNTDEAIAWFEAARAAGWLNATVALAALAEPADPERALRLFTEAAEAGHVGAQGKLGQHWLGLATPDGDARALPWLERAAAVGDPAASLQLGLLHFQGVGGGPADPARGAAYLRDAARMGNSAAQFALATALAGGTGVAADRVEAVIWLLQATRTGFDPAQPAMRELDERLTSEDKATLRAWLDGDRSRYEPPAQPLTEIFAGAAAGAPEDQAALGIALIERGVPGHEAVARFWLEQAAAAVPLAKHHLGILADRTGDDATARQWFASAAADGLATSTFSLGVMADGDGDRVAARGHFLAAARQGHVRAATALGLDLARSGKASVWPVAEHWLRRGAEGGNPEAQLRLARLYEGGGGVPASPSQAFRFRLGAAMAGDVESQRRVAAAYAEGAAAGGRVNAALVLTCAVRAGADALGSDLARLKETMSEAETADTVRLLAGVDVPPRRDGRLPENLPPTLALAEEPPATIVAAAEAGDAEAIANLARWHRDISIRPEANDRAIKLFGESAERGSLKSRLALAALLIRTGADDAAREQLDLARAAGAPDADYLLGWLLELGDDRAGADAAYRRAAEAGSSPARQRLAQWALAAAPPPDLVQQAEGGNADAQGELGRYYHEHSLAADADARADHWLTAGARAGSPSAIRHLAVRVGWKGDGQRAFQLLELAARQGDGQAALDIAASARHAGDRATAAAWIRAAMRAGYEPATAAWGRLEPTLTAEDRTRLQTMERPRQ